MLNNESKTISIESSTLSDSISFSLQYVLFLPRLLASMFCFAIFLLYWIKDDRSDCI